LTLVVAIMVPAPAAGASPCYERSRLDVAAVEATNQARRAAGLSTVSIDPELSRVAEMHSYWMDRKSQLFHSNRLAWKVTNWNRLGENVGLGNSITSLQAAFMNSPAHRQNILDPTFTYVGISVRTDGDRLWMTVIFESRANPGTRLTMPSC
jgi:uncharacterized protein YkwD